MTSKRALRTKSPHRFAAVYNGMDYCKPLLGRLGVYAIANPVSVPGRIMCAGGIEVFGRSPLRSVLFSTDPAVIEYSNADAVLAVYPFPPSARVIRAIVEFSGRPVFCGVGGGVTKGKKALEMAQVAEQCGASGVVLNQPAHNDLITAMKTRIGIPIVITIASSSIDVGTRIDAGADILNVSAGSGTADLVNSIRRRFSDVPIIATGGKCRNSIARVIGSGADAVTFVPPAAAQLFRPVMDRYRAATVVRQSSR